MIKFGLLGQVRKGKNIREFIELVKSFENEIKDKRISFSITGSVSSNRDEMDALTVNMPSSAAVLSRAEYNQRIMALDYILFFYNKNAYQFTASGPFFDALCFGKPIISLRNDYFEYMFRKYGEFGILVDSVKEMEEVIQTIIMGKVKPNYPFEEIQKRLFPENIAYQLKSVIGEVNIIT